MWRREQFADEDMSLSTPLIQIHRSPWVSDLAQKWARLSPTKWDKSGTFSDQISVHFGALRQNVLKSDLKKSRICPIWG